MLWHFNFQPECDTPLGPIQALSCLSSAYFYDRCKGQCRQLPKPLFFIGQALYLLKLHWHKSVEAIAELFTKIHVYFCHWCSQLHTNMVPAYFTTTLLLQIDILSVKTALIIVLSGLRQITCMTDWLCTDNFFYNSFFPFAYSHCILTSILPILQGANE